jgi:hypothetical protein
MLSGKIRIALAVAVLALAGAGMVGSVSAGTMVEYAIILALIP